MKNLREPNSQECLYFGRKLSCFVCNEGVIETNADDICIGSDRDDEIYYESGDFKPEGAMLRERVKIYLPDYSIEIDLEDVLRFSARNCRGIYDRVASEENANK